MLLRQVRPYFVHGVTDLYRLVATRTSISKGSSGPLIKDSIMGDVFFGVEKLNIIYDEHKGYFYMKVVNTYIIFIDYDKIPKCRISRDIDKFARYWDLITMHTLVKKQPELLSRIYSLDSLNKIQKIGLPSYEDLKGLEDIFFVIPSNRFECYTDHVTYDSMEDLMKSKGIHHREQLHAIDSGGGLHQSNWEGPKGKGDLTEAMDEMLEDRASTERLKVLDLERSKLFAEAEGTMGEQITNSVRDLNRDMNMGAEEAYVNKLFKTLRIDIDAAQEIDDTEELPEFMRAMQEKGGKGGK